MHAPAGSRSAVPACEMCSNYAVRRSACSLFSCRAQTPASGRKSRFSLPAGNAADATAAQEAGTRPHAPANTPTSALGEWHLHLKLSKSVTLFCCLGIDHGYVQCQTL